MNQKNILINSNNKIVSDYVKNFLYDFFSISDSSISFFNLNIDLNNSKNITDKVVFHQPIKSIFFKKKRKSFLF